MRAILGRDTRPELMLREALREAGLLGYRVQLRGVAGRPDVAFTRFKLAVFVHGCFWHRCPHCNLNPPKKHAAFWRKKFELNQARDARNIADLDRLGWTVIQFWECEVKRDPDACAAKVLRAKSEAEDAELPTLPHPKRKRRWGQNVAEGPREK